MVERYQNRYRIGGFIGLKKNEDTKLSVLLLLFLTIFPRLGGVAHMVERVRQKILTNWQEILTIS
jgi:hypothetical protein